MSIGLRDELAWFSVEMEKTLRENDHKSGYEHMSLKQLLQRLKQETGELERAIKKGKDVVSEATDVANFALFIAVVAENERLEQIEELDS